MQERRVSLLVAGEVRAADRPNEDCVSREDEPRFGASSQVRHEQRDAFRCVPGRVQDADDRVPHFDHLAVVERFEWERHVSVAVQVIRGPGRCRERPSARSVVGVHVRLDDVRDAHLLGARCGCVSLDV